MATQPEEPKGYGLFAPGTYWGQCEAICQRATDEALIATAYVAFQGGNGMVYPTQEILSRFPVAIEERNALRVENAKLREAIANLKSAAETLLSLG